MSCSICGATAAVVHTTLGRLCDHHEREYRALNGALTVLAIAADRE